MKAVQFVVFCAILVLVNGYHRYFWIGHGGVCKSSYDYTYYCIHYTNCQPSFYRYYPRGYSRICGSYHGVTTMCCAEIEEYPGQSFFIRKQYYFNQNFPMDTPPGNNFGIRLNSYNFNTVQFSHTKEVNYEPASTPKVQTQMLMTDIPTTTQSFPSEDVTISPENFPELIRDPTVLQLDVDTSTIKDSDQSSQGNLPESAVQGVVDTPARISVESSQANLPESGGVSPVQEDTTTPPPPTTTTTTTTPPPTTITPTISTTTTTTTSVPSESPPDLFTSKSLIPGGIDIDITSDLRIVENLTTTTENVVMVTEETTELSGLNSKAVLEDIQNFVAQPMPLVSVGSRERMQPPMEDLSLKTSSVLVDITRNIDQTVIGNNLYYPPTLENSTSLRMCRNWYENVSRENAFLNRTTNKAELGYGNETNTQWLCGGTLISERYVLTAARCQFSVSGRVRYVRLGNSRNITITDRQLQNFTVDSFTAHPLFDAALPQSHHDIGLIRLNASAVISNLIRPSCLSTKFSIASVPLWLISGGPINFVHIVRDRCQQFFDDAGIVDISDSLQECAVTDSYFYCEYTVGDPFIFINTDYEFGFFPSVVSVASYGTPCDDRPAVSTRVLPYVPWIERIVWPPTE